MSGDLRRFYGIGLLVCALMLLTAGNWLAAQAGNARAVAGAAFLVGLAAGIGATLALSRRDDSSLRQPTRRPGNRLFWRLVVGAVLVAVFDEALAGVPIFVATGAMTGVIGTILGDTRRRARE